MFRAPGLDHDTGVARTKPELKRRGAFVNRLTAVFSTSGVRIPPPLPFASVILNVLGRTVVTKSQTRCAPLRLHILLDKLSGRRLIQLNSTALTKHAGHFLLLPSSWHLCHDLGAGYTGKSLRNKRHGQTDQPTNEF